MSHWAWVHDPQSGGVPIPQRVQQETQKRLMEHTQKTRPELKLVIRFKNHFCYIDAYQPGESVVTHLCRLRYFINGWSLAFYTYSHEKYEPCIFPSGEWKGTPEEGFNASVVFL